MFKLLFFFFLLFIFYKIIQFVSKVYRIYSSAQSHRESQSKQNGKAYRKQYDGKTTIHFDPSKEKQENGSQNTRVKDDDYIDFQEIKKESK